jgi:hydrogenase expression/formation protein HypE
LILSEGFPGRDLQEVLDSIAAAAAAAEASVVTGDTKVVDREHGDGIYITTAGVGRVPGGRDPGPDKVTPGDVILLSGSLGEHGLAVLLARQMPSVQSNVRSDAAPLNHLVERIWTAAGDAVVFMRDPTRAGLAGLAADLAQHSGWNIVLEESAIPIKPQVRHASDLLGLDPLEIANEGKVVVVVRPGAAPAVLAAMQGDPLGRDAAVIGFVEDTRDGLCRLRTSTGGRRIVQKPYGEQLPRIC